MRHDYSQQKSKAHGWGKEKKRDPSKKDDDAIAVKSVKLRDFQKTQTAPLLLDLLDEAYERRMVDVRSPTRRLEDNPVPPVEHEEDPPERSRFPVLQTNKHIEKLIRTLPGYNDPSAISEQCSSVMTHFENIRPIIGFHTATQELLMCLEGPIAVECRDEEYFAPIAIWIHKGFPEEPPSVFVTSNGVVLQHGHSHVSPQGEVLSPYLRDWCHTSSLIGLLDTLVNLFSHNPVFAVSSDSEDLSKQLYDVFTNDPDTSDEKEEPLNKEDIDVDSELQKLFVQFNETDDGKMTFDQFVDCWKGLALDPDCNLLDTFKLLDATEKGFIQIDEFVSFVKSWEQPNLLIDRHSEFVKRAVHEFLGMTGLWPMCEHVLTKNKYNLQKSYDEFCTRGIGQMIQIEAKELLQTLPKKIEIERLQRYEAEIQHLMQENTLLKERLDVEHQKQIIADTWYDGTENLSSVKLEREIGSENLSSEMRIPSSPQQEKVQSEGPPTE